MDNRTLNEYAARLEITGDRQCFYKNILTRGPHFRVPTSMLEFAISTANNNRGSAIPRTARLPHEHIVLSTEHNRVPMVLLLFNSTNDEVCVGHMADGRAYLSGSYQPGADRLGRSVSLHGSPYEKHCLVVAAAFMVSLINQPRLTISREVRPPRQQQRRAERVLGMSPKGWTEVTWNIGRAVVPIGKEITEEGHPKALHWCRGHYRRAQQTHPRAEWLEPPDVLVPDWYVWVKDCWKGDPAYGLRLQRHTPLMPGEKKARPGAAAPSRALDEARFKALAQAERQALVEAGFAPSSKLH